MNFQNSSYKLVRYFGQLKMNIIAFNALSAQPSKEDKLQLVYGVVRTAPSMVPYVGEDLPPLVKNCNQLIPGVSGIVVFIDVCR